MRAETQVPSSRRPSAEATAAPVAETAIVETQIAGAPVAEAPVVEPAIMEETPADALTATPSLPAPMETGGLVMAHHGLNRWRKLKKSRSSTAGWPSAPTALSRRWEPTSRLPFPLQDHAGRFASITQLYEHAAAQPAASHNAVGRAIRHLHPKLLPHQATSLGNQVACMIVEYHLTVSAHQSSLHPILPPEVATLLPAIKNYVLGVSFEGTRDVRVMDHAVALQVAVWLHWLNMATGGKALAPESLEAGQHHQGPLLESFLAPRMSGLTFQEVVDQVLTENCRAADQSLRHLQERHTREWQVLEGLIKVHGELDKADKAAQKSLKKEIDQRRKGLEMLKERMLHYEAQLGQEPSEGSTPSGNGQVCHSAQAEVAPVPVADDAPSGSTEVPAPDPLPAEDQDQAMEVDDETARPSLPSPVSHEEDDLLTGLPPSGAMEVESGLAQLSVSAPRGLNGECEEASP